jgi:hypothetical protein
MAINIQYVTKPTPHPIWIMACLCIILFSGCNTVKTTQPLPSADTPVSEALPTLLEGDFVVIGGEERAFNEFGRQHVRISFSDPQHCMIETFIGFEANELSDHPRAKYFHIVGGYLHYQNDSLIQELARYRTKTEEAPENEEDLAVLKTLEFLEENGQMHQVYPITRWGNLWAYNRSPFMQINLETGLVTGYDGPNMTEEGQAVIKERKGRLFVNVEEEKNGWQTGIFQIAADTVTLKYISYGHVLKNKTAYQESLGLTQPSKSTIVLNPSLTALDEAMEKDGFLEDISVLVRVDTGQESKNPNRFWYILLGAAVIIAFRFLNRPKRKQA